MQVVAMGPPDDIPMSPNDMLNSVIPPQFKEVLQIVLGMKAAFAEKFGKAASLPKADVVRMASEVVRAILDQYLNVQAANTALDMVGGVGGIFPPAQMVPPSQIADVLGVSVGTTRSFLSGGGMRRLLEAIITLFDANNDGTITKVELLGVLDNFQALTASSSIATAKPIAGE